MSLIQNLIGNSAWSRAQEQREHTAEIQQRIGVYQGVLQDLKATPEAKQFAQTDILNLLSRHGVPEGKKHARRIGQIVSGLAGIGSAWPAFPASRNFPISTCALSRS